MHGVGSAAVSAIFNHKMNQNALNVKGGKPSPETTPDTGAAPEAEPEFTTMVSGEIVMRENHFSVPEPTVGPTSTEESGPGVEADFTASLRGHLHMDEEHFGTEKSILRDEGKAKAYFQRLASLQKLTAKGLISNDAIKKLTDDQVCVLALDVVQERLLNRSIKLDDVLHYSPTQIRNLIIQTTRDLITTGKASYEEVLNLSFNQHNRLSFPHVRDQIGKPDGSGLTFFEAADMTKKQENNLHFPFMQKAIENGWISVKDAINLTEPQRSAISKLDIEFSQRKTITEDDRNDMGLAIAEIVGNPDEYVEVPIVSVDPTNIRPEVAYTATNVEGMVQHESLLTAG